MKLARLAPALAPLAALPLMVAPAHAQQSPSPEPSPAPVCGGIAIPSNSDFGSIDTRTVAGTPAVLAYSTRTATATVTVTRTSPEPVAVVREQQATNGRVEFSFAVAENTTLESRTSADDAPCQPLVRRISVASRVSINARRNAPRDYTFSGRVFPARGQLVTLRTIPRNNTSNAQPRIIAQGRTDSNGVYTINRKFTGSGEFFVYAGAGAVPTNTEGTSLGRPTVIH